MVRLTLPPLLLIAALSLAGCSDRQPNTTPPDGTGHDEAEKRAATASKEAAAERDIETDAKIGALTNEVDRLEQSVADLQSGADNRSTVEARVTALEQKVYASDPVEPTPSPSPRPSR
jgi:hypothetical protein